MILFINILKIDQKSDRSRMKSHDQGLKKTWDFDKEAINKVVKFSIGTEAEIFFFKKFGSIFESSGVTFSSSGLNFDKMIKISKCRK